MTTAKPLKVVAFNGSFKQNGNTAQLIEMVFSELRKEGIECELVTVGNAKYVSGCTSCGGCKDILKCVRAGPEDPIHTWFAKMREADGIILGSPTHFANVSVEMKSLIDRCGALDFNNGNLLKHKIGAAVVAVRRGGAASVFDEIHVVSSCYWNNGIGLKPGDVQNDEEGVRIMKTLGKNMAYLLKKMNDPRTADIKPPE